MTRTVLRAAATIAFLALSLSALPTPFLEHVDPAPGSGTLDDPSASIRHPIDPRALATRKSRRLE